MSTAINTSSGPVKRFPLAEAALDAYQREESRPLPDFTDTETAFRHLSDRELRGTRRLFWLMGKPWLTRFMGAVGTRLAAWGVPGAAWIVRKTLYRQFVGGANLERAGRTVRKLAKREVGSILDYGSEGLQTDTGIESAAEECTRATTFAAETPDVWGSVVKLTSLIPFQVLAEYNNRELSFDILPHPALERGLRLLDRICRIGRERGCEVYLDAEESWIQNTIDRYAEEMMRRHNRGKVTVLTTIQLYRHDRLAYLKALHRRAAAQGFVLGVKLVRGAYMVKEARRAREMSYANPIQPDIKATHRDYDAAVRYCLDHREEIVTILASHNEDSVGKLLRMMQDHGVPRNHPNLQFSQLLGMSDNLTFNLAAAGYRVSKYMVYGPVREVLPYLTRRAQENTSVTGEAGRELTMLDQEIRRRSR